MSKRQHGERQVGKTMTQSVVLVNHDCRCLRNWHGRWRRKFLCGGTSSKLRAKVFFITLPVALLSRLSEHDFLPIHHPALLRGLLLARACNLSSSLRGLHPFCTLFLLLPLGAVFCSLSIGLLLALSLPLLKFTRNQFLPSRSGT